MKRRRRKRHLGSVDSCRIGPQIDKLKNAYHPKIGMKNVFEHHVANARNHAERGECRLAARELHHARKVARY
jgi:hypothetical protein